VYVLQLLKTFEFRRDGTIVRTSEGCIVSLSTMLKSCEAEANGMPSRCPPTRNSTYTTIGDAVTFPGLCKVRRCELNNMLIRRLMMIPDPSFTSTKMSVKRISGPSSIYFEEEEINWKHGLSQVSETFTGNRKMPGRGLSIEAARHSATSQRHINTVHRTNIKQLGLALRGGDIRLGQHLHHMLLPPRWKLRMLPSRDLV
jgi:hypothetical protein